MPTANQDTHVNQLLSQMRALPDDAKKERVVLWKIFRDAPKAVEYSHHILLESDQQLVGGCSTDSAGVFFWLGVEVADLAAWGNTHAIQLADPFEGNDPKTNGQGFGS